MPLVLFAALGAVLVGLVALRLLTGGAAGPLAPSGPEETALRAMRLAGIQRAVVAGDDGTAILRLELPVITSPPDAEIAWLAGFATLAEVWPEAERYTVQLFEGARPLVELRAEGPDVRAAVAEDDAVALRDSLDPRFIARSGEPVEAGTASDDVARIVPERELSAARSLLVADPEGATALPAGATAIDVHLAGGYLDAKNRAAGLLGDAGPLSEAAAALSRQAEAVRRSAPPVAAPGPGESVVARYLERLSEAVGPAAAGGAEGLRLEAEALVERGDRDAIARLRALVICAEALAGRGGVAGVLNPAADLARQVADAPLVPGPPSDAVLSAAGVDDAPEQAADVRAFRREPALDVRADQISGRSELPAVVLRLHARSGTPPAIGWPTAGGGTSVAPAIWEAHRRADGAVYWLAGDEGTVALVDASVLGWAFSTRRAAVVDAARCGRVEAFFPTE